MKQIGKILFLGIISVAVLILSLSAYKPCKKIVTVASTRTSQYPPEKSTDFEISYCISISVIAPEPALDFTLLTFRLPAMAYPVFAVSVADDPLIDGLRNPPRS